MDMAWFEDLSACDYFGDEFAQFLRAVGWLERGKPYSTDSCDERVFRKLSQLCKEPWGPSFRGLHNCDLCQFEGDSGYRNLFVPGGEFIFVCPELIVHYINAHGYCPPTRFCDAVLSCPRMRSIEYHKALLASGGRPLVKSHTK